MSVTIKTNEVETGRNVSNWNREDFIKLFESFFSVKRGSFNRNKHEVIHNIEAMHLTNENDIISIIRDIAVNDISIEKIVEQSFFFDHQELKQKIDMALGYLESDGSADQYLYLKVSFCLAWEGLKLADIVEVRISDFNAEYTALTFNGTKYHIHPEFVADIKRLAELKYFVANNGRMSGYTVEASDYLIRTSSSPKFTNAILLARITDINTACVKKLVNKVFHIDKIYSSGFLYRLLKEEEKVGALYKVFEKGNIRMLKKEVIIEILPKTGATNSPMYLTDYVRLLDAYKRVYYKMPRW